MMGCLCRFVFSTIMGMGVFIFVVEECYRTDKVANEDIYRRFSKPPHDSVVINTIINSFLGIH
ncbi:hypothetical protein SISNIDRAFT_1297 [Sistotremastrum niveocremeum HHB9708]|uniref:Uncharacterized protein n=1 Tax=Sistotremastrum niveocremeum HHB9708 TaxID=1314777 RepID=A0A165ACN1_9AGAM|nr:hypothetical protein SISNIDRAFT_1297 [Sistotremastrum niveocremeum HHB9708]